MRIASIDIGTNTCKLSVADYDIVDGLNFIYKDKKIIALINPEFQGGEISQNTIENLVDVLKNYKQIVESFNVDKLITTATSAVRSSNNKCKIIERIKEATDIHVEIIDGKTEAEYVYVGVTNAVDIGNKPVLVVDIGGGSVEFIICDEETIFSSFSFDIGATRLLYDNDFSDPFTNKDLVKLNSILNETLHDLLMLCKSFKIKTLIGSSGSFEVFLNLINEGKSVDKKYKNRNNSVINIEKFETIYQKLISYTYQQRCEMLGMDLTRVKIIPFAAFITQFLTKNIGLKKIIQSKYSIKEGLIFNYINKNFKTDEK
ncbi:hypothetical protein LJC11_04225 [Bacteroidales bacterium OttesenSCG-928-I21]|nr:hypothetical protein [Bacteroidales bacterium OttesenSCG-928-I21]